MNLRDGKFPRILDTSTHDIVREFFEPALRSSLKYDRGVGFFSSGWLRVNARGMAHFASQGGRARWITSPILSKEDWQAMTSAPEDQRRKFIRDGLIASIPEIEKAIERETLNALAWLVADGIVQFKLAAPRGKLSGEFHDKFGVFEDATKQRISFNGSYNDSIQGLRNYESIKVFRGWEDAERELVDHDAIRFNRLWDNKDPNVEVFDIHHDAVERILQLRTAERPYTPPLRAPEPRIPSSLHVRDYQKQAIKAWLSAQGRGIWKMATGTGKTITALSAASKLREAVPHEKALLTVVVCPYRHLVTQWNEEARNFGFSPLLCYQSRETWFAKLSEIVTDANLGVSKNPFVIVTNATLLTEPFQALLGAVTAPFLFIADEAHNLGSDRLAASLPANATWRLGLSATPERHHDDVGTQRISEYFGPVAFEIDLKTAIANGALTPYRYFPVLIDLTANELDEYLRLSSKITQLVSSGKDDSDEYLKSLLIKRARLLASAEQKLPRLLEIFKASTLEQTTHNLVYCGDGRVDSELTQEEMRQVEATTEALGKKLGMVVAQYTSETRVDERKAILERFADGQIQALIAIRCLDEGVDVPATRRAFILASSTNPRQFIQRRGRVLRRAPGKDRAEIWDFVVVPPASALSDETFATERNLIKRELLRVLEFADSAENGPQAHTVLRGLKKDYNLLDM